MLIPYALWDLLFISGLNCMYSKFVADLNVASSSISLLLTALNFGVGNKAG